MLRPKITIEMLSVSDKLLYAAIRDTAKPDEFKLIFEAQAFGGVYSLKNALAALFKGSTDLKDRIIGFVNDDLRYSPTLAGLVSNKEYFDNIIIPTRDADFMMSDVAVGQDVFFWVEERMELTIESKSHKPYLAKLMVDDKSDSLLFNNGQDSWIEYGSKLTRHHKTHDNNQVTMDFGDKVALKYKEFLAEKQLLKD